jgi:AcrR family transcriptional regulator
LSHHRIVDVAARAVRRAGYRGVGVADIMKEAGLTHGGFYAHFESRDALLVEAMQRAGQDNLVSLSDGIERRLRQGGTRFRALVETYLNDAHIEWTEDGCVIAALASEMTRQHDAVRTIARQPSWLRRWSAHCNLLAPSAPKRVVTSWLKRAGR